MGLMSGLFSDHGRVCIPCSNKKKIITALLLCQGALSYMKIKFLRRLLPSFLGHSFIWGSNQFFITSTYWSWCILLWIICNHPVLYLSTSGSKPWFSSDVLQFVGHNQYGKLRYFSNKYNMTADQYIVWSIHRWKQPVKTIKSLIFISFQVYNLKNKWELIYIKAMILKYILTCCHFSLVQSECILEYHKLFLDIVFVIVFFLEYLAANPDKEKTFFK